MKASTEIFPIEAIITTDLMRDHHLPTAHIMAHITAHLLAHLQSLITAKVPQDLLTQKSLSHLTLPSILLGVSPSMDLPVDHGDLTVADGVAVVDVVTAAAAVIKKAHLSVNSI